MIYLVVLTEYRLVTDRHSAYTALAWRRAVKMTTTTMIKSV